MYFCASFLHGVASLLGLFTRGSWQLVHDATRLHCVEAVGGIGQQGMANGRAAGVHKVRTDDQNTNVSSVPIGKCCSKSLDDQSIKCIEMFP